MKIGKSTWIINGFALLHAATAAVCRVVGVDDSLPLTLMTMLMTVWLCQLRGYSLEITAACAILVNVAGFLLGIGAARLMGLLGISRFVVYPVATFVTTEILGWAIVLLTRLFHVPRSAGGWRASVKWLTLAFLAIIVLRFGFVEAFPYLYGSSAGFLRTAAALFGNASALLVVILADLLYVRYVRRWREGRWVKLLVFILCMVGVAAVAAVMVVFNFPFVERRAAAGAREWTGMWMLAVVLVLTVYCVVYLIDYALTADRAKEEARRRAGEAQFRYVKLKQQVSPHFFFNSLNSLDCLVCEGRTELASEYIHKLAGIYRYMLGRGEEELVRLRDEMTFVGMYVDMMGLRYGSGLEVRIEIGEEMMGRMVVPCAVQLLIENAVKHNVVSEEEPMRVEVVADGEGIMVRNALRPRLTASSEGSGHGLAYIREIYGNLGREVVIRKTETEYVVTLPLI